jgi:hypothetical protein
MTGPPAIRARTGRCLSDHGPFHMAGIAFLYIGVEDHEHYHQPSDEF